MRQLDGGEIAQSKKNLLLRHASILVEHPSIPRQNAPSRLYTTQPKQSCVAFPQFLCVSTSPPPRCSYYDRPRNIATRPRADPYPSLAIRKPPRPPSTCTNPYTSSNMLVALPDILRRSAKMLTLESAWTRCRRHHRVPGRKALPVQGQRNGCQGLRRGQAHHRPARLLRNKPPQIPNNGHFICVRAMWEAPFPPCCRLGRESRVKLRGFTDIS